jgi:HEAT repeat protein
MKATEAVQPLIGLLHDEDPFVRSSAARALGAMGPAEALGPLLDLLRDGHFFVRSLAAEALGEMKALEALDPLVALMGHANDRKAAVRALAELVPEVCRKSPKGIQVVIPARNA